MLSAWLSVSRLHEITMSAAFVSQPIQMCLATCVRQSMSSSTTFIDTTYLLASVIHAMSGPHGEAQLHSYLKSDV